MPPGAILSAQNYKLAFVMMVEVAPITTLAFPTPTPALAAPISATPPTEHGAIDDAAFAKLKHAFAPFGAASVNAQYFYPAVIWIDTKSVISHYKCAVVPSQLF